MVICMYKKINYDIRQLSCAICLWYIFLLFNVSAAVFYPLYLHNVPKDSQCCMYTFMIDDFIQTIQKQEDVGW